MDKIDVNYLVEQYKNGRSAKSLAEEFGCSHRMICDRLRPYNILRSPRNKTMTYEERIISRKRFDKDYNKTEAHAKAHKKRRERNKDKVSARSAVAYAVKKNKLQRVSTLICKDCGKQAQAYDHYMGYEKENWLNVEPVCAKCNKTRSKR